MPAIFCHRAVQPIVTVAVALLASEDPPCGRSRELAWSCSPPPDPLRPVHAVGRKVCQRDDTAARWTATMPGKGQDEGRSWQPAAGR
jgi:hypothetical protein